MTAGGPSRSPQDREGTASGDLIAGAVAAVFGTAVLLHVRTFPELPDGAPGPALFPGIIGGLFVLFGLVLVAQSLARRRSSPAAAAAVADDADRPGWVDALAVLGAVTLYLLVSPVLGFLVTMALALLGLMWRLGAGLRVAVPAAVGTTAVIWVLFEQVLQVPLPAGVLG